MSLDALPSAALARILTFLPSNDVLTCERVSKRLRQATKQHSELISKSNRGSFNVTCPGLSISLRPEGDYRRTLTFSVRRREAVDRGYAFDVSSPSLLVVLHDVSKRHFRLASNSDVRETTLNVVRRLSERFSFSSVFLVEISPEELKLLLSMVKSLRAISLEKTAFTEADLLSTLGESEVVDAFRFQQSPSSLSHFSTAFWQSHFVHSLRILEILAQKASADLDDATFFELRRIRLLRLQNVDTKVTVRGLRAVLDDWKAGKRSYHQLEVHLQKTSTKETTEGVVKALHKCGSQCTKLAHFIGGWSLFVRNYSSSWKVSIDVA